MNTLASRSPILPSSTAIVTDAPASGSPILLHPQRWRSSSAIGMDAPAQGSKNWLRHAGASIAMALDGRWRWEGGSLTLTLRLRWRLIDAGVEKGAKTGSVTLALPLRWRVTGAGVGREPSSRRSSCAIASAPPRPAPPRSFTKRLPNGRKYDVDNCNHSETASNIEGRRHKGWERNRRQQSSQARAFCQLAPQSNVLTHDSIVMARVIPDGLDSGSGTAFDRWDITSFRVCIVMLTVF